MYAWFLEQWVIIISASQAFVPACFVLRNSCPGEGSVDCSCSSYGRFTCCRLLLLRSFSWSFPNSLVMMSSLLYIAVVPLLASTAAASLLSGLSVTSLLSSLGPAPANDPRFTNFVAPGHGDGQSLRRRFDYARSDLCSSLSMPRA